MISHSRTLAPAANGVVLDVALEELRFTAYVVVSVPDVELVADFVPGEQFDAGGDLHVTAIADESEAASQVEELAFNMNPGDAAVFLCANEAAYDAAIQELDSE